jgi:hypothetical protein
VIGVKANDLNPYSSSGLYCVGFALNAHIVYYTPACAAGLDDLTADADHLMQNSPNPFSQATSIDYVLNSSAKAQIGVYGVDGKLVKTYELSKGKGSVMIGAGELSAGAYMYTMYVDGVAADTKLMIITADK